MKEEFILTKDITEESLEHKIEKLKTGRYTSIAEFISCEEGVEECLKKIDKNVDILAGLDAQRKIVLSEISDVWDKLSADPLLRDETIRRKQEESFEIAEHISKLREKKQASIR